MATAKSLQQALTDILKEEHKVSKWDARAIKELILADGRVSTEERRFLEDALKGNAFDDQAYQILHELLMRDELKNRK